MATYKDIELMRRDTEVMSGTVTSSGVAYNITGYTIKFTVKKNVGDTDAQAIIGPIAGVIVSGSDGTYQVSLSRINTDVEPGVYFYDVQINNGSSTIVKTVIYGKCTIIADVTKTPN